MTQPALSAQIPGARVPIVDQSAFSGPTRPLTTDDIPLLTGSRPWFMYWQNLGQGVDGISGDANTALLFSLTNSGGAGGGGSDASGTDILPNNIFLPDDDGFAPIVGILSWSQTRDPLGASSAFFSHNNASHTLSYNEAIPGGAGTSTFQMVGGTRAKLIFQTTTSFGQVSTDVNTLFISMGNGTLEYASSPNRLARGSSDPCSLGKASAGFNQLFMARTNTATIGAVTINQPTGRVNIAAGGTSVVVTNSLSKSDAGCHCNLNGAPDATAKSANADTSTNGQITITLNAACTGNVAIDFFLSNFGTP